MSGATKAALLGALLGVAFLAAGAVAYFLGLVQLPGSQASVDKVLVIASAPDEEGTELASVVFVIDTKTGTVSLPDTFAQVTVSGTSARTARESLPFGGGAAVAQALSSQTGGTLPWIVVHSEEWARLIDQAGGIRMSVPVGVSAYRDGKLTLVSPGERALTGDEAVAVAAGLPFLDEAVREAVAKELSSAVSAAFETSPSTLKDLVESRRATSSLDARQVPLLGSQP